MAGLYKIPLVLSPQPEGGYTVTCPLLPELVTEGGTIDEVLENVRDALAAVLELYRDLNKPLPEGLHQSPEGGPLWLETLVGAP